MTKKYKKNIHVFGLGIEGTGHGIFAGMGYFSIHGLKKQKKVNDKIKQKDINCKKTGTMLFFITKKDVDIMIKKLKDVKVKMGKKND